MLSLELFLYQLYGDGEAKITYPKDIELIFIGALPVGNIEKCKLAIHILRFYYWSISEPSRLDSIPKDRVRFDKIRYSLGKRVRFR